MGLASYVKLGIGNLIGNDANQYVADENKLDNELIIAMNAKEKAKISAEDAALLSKVSKEADEFAKNIDESQKNSIVLHASDMVIRAKNVIEKWIKEKRANKKLASNLEKSFASKGDLPKDYIVAKADETNGKIPTIAAGELENQPRALGGKERDSRTRK